ncbi:MAG: hypothetical protein E3J21_05105 [Anaerolineales bacterium]|nr:MAG: hypothetical protein E3J21_05105 [Anaerolineales bacterium]
MGSLLKKPATQQLKLRFFDLEANIQSDSASYIHIFAQMYRRFRVNGAPAPVQPPVEFVVLTNSDNAWGQPVMILDGQVQLLSNIKFLEGYTYDGILNAIVAGVQSHFLIHAGVVSGDGQGIILAADSSHGKTTLVLELVRRGFKFLSDEMAALGRADRWVHPFPRSLRVRPGTLELAGFPQAAAGAPAWLGKLILDIEEIQPDSMGQAAPISHIIILRDPAEAQAEQPDGPERELGVLVDRLDESLLAAVRQIEGVTEVHPDIERGYPTLRLRAAHRMSVLPQIEALCQEQQILVLDISKRTERQPTFEATARLETVPNSQAVMELLRRFQGGHKSALLQDEFGGSSTRLFMELAALVGQANCHQLFVGPLHEMADLMCGLVGASKPHET